MQTPTILHQIQYCSLSTVTTLRVGGSGVRISAGVKDFFLQQKVRTDSWTHPDYYSIGTGVISREQNGRDLTLITYLHLAPRLGTIRTVPLLPLDALLACTETITPPSTYLTIVHFNIIWSTGYLHLQSVSFRIRFSSATVNQFSISTIRAKYPPHSFLCVLVTLAWIFR